VRRTVLSALRGAVAVFGLVSLLLLSSPSAWAREYAPPPSGGGLVENTDGTWSFYSAGGSTPLRTYSSAEHETLRRLAVGLELDTGTTGQTANVVSGIGSTEVAEDETLASRLRTGELYKSPGEAEVGDGVIEADEAIGTLPEKAYVLNVADDVFANPGPFRIGVGIGAGLGELYTLPVVPGGTTTIVEAAPREDDEVIRNYYRHFRYPPGIGIFPKVTGKATCEELLPYGTDEEVVEERDSMLASFEAHGFALTDYCEYADINYESWSTYEYYYCEHGCSWSFKETEPELSRRTGAWGGTPPMPPCPSNWVPCAHAVFKDEGEQVHLYVDDGEARPGAFPASGVASLKTAESSSSEVSPQSALKTPVSPAEPRIGATPYVGFLLGPEDGLVPGIEGPGVPNPFRSPRASEGWGGLGSGSGGPGFEGGEAGLGPWLARNGGGGGGKKRGAGAFGSGAQARPDWHPCFAGKPVNCATGNEVESQTDLTVGGRGPELKLTRTYNSQLAAEQSTPGPFGYGWTGSYSSHLELADEGKEATVYQEDGSTVAYTKSGETWTPTGRLVEATLAGEGSGYVYTLPDQVKVHFNSTGELTKEEDRNGNALTVGYNTKGLLESVTSSAGHKIMLAYNSADEVESASDPMGHTVKYSYESGKLASVTLPGETSPRWQFKYNSSHELTSETDGRGNATTIEYNDAEQVVSQTDAMHRTRKWSYAATAGLGTETTITEPNGSATVERFNEDGEPTSVTRALGTSIAATTTDGYNGAGELIAVTDPDGYKTEYGYNSSGDMTSEKNADGDETKWEYDSTHDVTGITQPNGEKTTIERDGHGNALKVSRPAPGETTQVTKYKYDSHGDVETMTDPLGYEWKYEYDGYGDRTAETDPEGNKRTLGFNEDSQETSTVSPRGHVKGAKESSFTTTIERTALGQVKAVTNPLKDKAEYTYDADGDLETVTDPEANRTTYTYNADDEPVKTEEPNKTITETEYNSEGQVIAQADGNKHTTKYERNALGEVTEEVNPLSQKTKKEYDAAGNLVKLIDAEGRTTTYRYDPANRLVEVTYSDGKTPTDKYEYNSDGDRTKIVDGTGETTNTFDKLDRLTESKNGHGETVKYEYNLDNNPVKVTYPNGKAVTRAYDKDDRLESVTDWLEHTTSFAYNPDSDLASTTFPTATGDVDKYGYNDADAMSEVEMNKGSEALASIEYTRDKDGGVTKATDKGLAGEEKESFSYDENSRVTKGAGVTYKYDAANNPTTVGSDTYAYNSADELETATASKKTADTYTFNEVGERTKTTPASGPATSYGYDEAGNLISVTRPKEGETPAIEDSYAYNGEGLRASETVGATTSYLAWDTVELELPLILSNGADSFVYGPSGVPIEQINNSTSAVTYLHHDQQGSTRLLTGEGGKTEATFTYGAYGEPTGHTGTATTPLGYGGQYTSSDTGLVYMRARVYDPATAQFVSADPLVKFTRAPYTYSGDNPVNHRDPSGLVTVGICVSGEVALGVRVGGGVCGQLSSSGQIGVTGTVNGGIASGAGVSAGIGVQGSNAERIEELGGPFVHLGGSVHAGGGVSADTFYGGANACGNRITGGEISLGVGGGADQYGGVSETETFAVGL
jgi:RHS repeat-associated protein